nr:uncharacterized protein CI109_006017 [Kwoniella shandongensis]KAA5525709.1 hypothetical protein CI109_006017 [Kwoniella shandongensis]
MTTTESKIAIVGAGVFGLSTALHLNKQGYKDVTVFDYQPYDQNAYNPSEGCDSASADVNKIYRCSYGDEIEYQDLALSGRPIWLEWNELLRSTPADQLPKGLTPEDDLFVPCGFLRISSGGDLSDYDKECLVQLEKAGLRKYQHVLASDAHISNENDMDRLWDLERRLPAHWEEKVYALKQAGGGGLDGFIDTSAGLTYADKSCAWARHLCEKAGVKFVLGPESGKLDDLLIDGKEGNDRKVVGLRTVDGKEYRADVVVVACGGWTPSVVSEASELLETTAGSVCTITLPEDRPDLWDKFSPERFPVWSYGLTGHNSPEYGGFYGFPRTREGKIKIGRISTPKTKYTADRAVNLPKKAITYLKQVIGEIFPELTGIGITDTRMCWYTDSIDNSFVIDYVPGYSDSLFVASGGSGHGFKFLPVLGKHVVNALEKKQDQFTPLWHWRSRVPGHHANGLEEGEMSGRNLATLEMAEEKDWKWIDKGEVKVGKDVEDITTGVNGVAIEA